MNVHVNTQIIWALEEVGLDPHVEAILIPTALQLKGKVSPNTFICFKINRKGNNPVSFLPFSNFGNCLLRYYDNQPMFGRLEVQKDTAPLIVHM